MGLKPSGCQAPHETRTPPGRAQKDLPELYLQVPKQRYPWPEKTDGESL